MQIKKGDNVKVLVGKDRGKTGRVLRAMPKEEKVIAEGINVMKKHVKGKSGGIIEQAMPIHASNVAKIKE